MEAYLISIGISKIVQNSVFELSEKVIANIALVAYTVHIAFVYLVHSAYMHKIQGSDKGDILID